MTISSEKRSIIAKAEKDGCSAMEVNAALVAYDIAQFVIEQLRKRETPFSRLNEREQDAVIRDVDFESKKIADLAAYTIASRGTESVLATMKSLKIDSKLTATLTIEGDAPNRHILTDKAHDKSGVLIVLYPGDYGDGQGMIEPDRDQKPLPLEEKAAAKPTGKGKSAGKETAATKPAAGKTEPKKIELTEAVINAALEFMHKFQNATTAGLQNQLKIGLDKAEALLAVAEERGVVTAKAGDGTRQYIQPGSATADPKTAEQAAVDAGAPESPADETQEDAGESSTVGDDVYDKIKDGVISNQRISLGYLQKEFGLTAAQAKNAMGMLEADEIISEENEMGGRAVLVQPEDD